MKYGNKITMVWNPKIDGYRVMLKFRDGTQGEVSLDPIFSEPKNLAAEVLEGELFEKCFVESGALAWPNGLELCPDAVKMWMVAQEKLKSENSNQVQKKA